MKRTALLYGSLIGNMLLAAVLTVMSLNRWRHSVGPVGEACDVALLAEHLHVLYSDEASEREQITALRRIAESRCSSGAHHVAWFAYMHPTLGPEAIDTLRHLGDRPARDAMLEAMGSVSEQTGIRAVEALAELADARSLAYLEGMLRGRVWTLAPERVFRAMGIVGGPVSEFAKERIEAAARSDATTESERIWAAFAAIEIGWDSDLSLWATRYLLELAMQEGPWQSTAIEAVSRISYPPFGIHYHDLWDAVLRAAGDAERARRGAPGATTGRAGAPGMPSLEMLLRHAALSQNRGSMGQILYLAVTAYGVGEDVAPKIMEVLRQTDPIEYQNALRELRSR